jgi:hypothetical protein
LQSGLARLSAVGGGQEVVPQPVGQLLARRALAVNSKLSYSPTHSFEPCPGARLDPMTTREKAHKLLDELPESEIEPVLDFIASRGAAMAEPGVTVDEWGDLSKLHEVTFGETMHRLAEKERAAGHEPW